MSPKRKWALLFDEGDAWYGLMTTNLAEVYNWVLRGVRSLPLVGIVEFFLYRTCEYFRDRYAVAQKDMADNQKVYGYKISTWRRLLKRPIYTGSLQLAVWNIGTR